MTALTKADMADILVEQLGLNKRESRDMVDCFFDEIRQTLAKGRDVKLSGFGNFILRDKPPRPGRNPRTGEDALITARRVVTFKAGQKLREHIEASIVRNKAKEKSHKNISDDISTDKNSDNE